MIALNNKQSTTGYSNGELHSSGKNGLFYRDALRLIVSAEAPENHSQIVREELTAIVSHWLQSPEQIPILLDESYKEKWNKILNTYQTFGEGLPATGRKTKVSRCFRINFSGIPFPPQRKPKFTFIDLFAGIGGFRIALQGQGGKCVFSSEWDQDAQWTYFKNYGEVPFGDIKKITSRHFTDSDLRRIIPDHDILAGGFPCQPFSRAGVSARSSLGQNHGFLCKVQGTLFFNLIRIAKVKRPKVLFLENVKNLQTHNGGDTYNKIRDIIENDLKYRFQSKILDSSSLVPQRRKRCYIVAFRDSESVEIPELTGPAKALSQILEANPREKFTLSDRMWQGHIKRTNRNLQRGAGFTAYEADLNKPANTLVARYYKDGKECLIPQKDKNPRLLTPRECAKLQGYPEDFIMACSDSQMYRQFGNSVTVPVISHIAKAIVAKL